MTTRGTARVQHPTRDPFLLRGLIACTVCQRGLVPVFDPRSGERSYSCGPVCPQPAVPAEPAESDMLLAALIRAAAVTLPTTNSDACDDEFGPVSQMLHRIGATSSAPVVSAEEMERWRECEPTDRRAMLNVAYLAVHVTEAGQVRPVWRHHAELVGTPT
ncbi:MAG: hypothetical protein ACRDT4_11115 [Micromonosporaceae bacterium]